MIDELKKILEKYILMNIEQIVFPYINQTRKKINKLNNIKS